MEEEKITPKQSLYREYLKSDTWKDIRENALRYYRYTCQHCGGEGRDVHHVYYPETWGQESIKDLLVLCRKCHDIEHTPIPEDQKKSTARMEQIHVRAISSFLSEQSTKELQEEFPDKNLHELFLSDTQEGSKARKLAIKLLNIQEFFTHGGKKYSSTYGLYDFVEKTELFVNHKSQKQLKQEKEEMRKSQLESYKAKQKNMRKCLEQSNPRLYRKLDKTN